jgi:hypothetical protein
MLRLSNPRQLSIELVGLILSLLGVLPSGFAVQHELQSPRSQFIAENAGMCTYDLRPDNCDGTLWTVYDVETGNPAMNNGVPCSGLSLADADDLADAMNYLEANSRHDVVMSLPSLGATQLTRPCNECRQLIHA